MYGAVVGMEGQVGKEWNQAGDTSAATGTQCTEVVNIETAALIWRSGFAP